MVFFARHFPQLDRVICWCAQVKGSMRPEPTELTSLGSTFRSMAFSRSSASPQARR